MPRQVLREDELALYQIMCRLPITLNDLCLSPIIIILMKHDNVGQIRDNIMTTRQDDA